jgi:hypothetical protein
MNPRTQAPPGYYVWEVEGQPVTIHLHLEVVDRLGPEIMRGFGAVPKRGAEVGGLLLGAIEQEAAEDGVRTVVRIEDFEPVACDYKRGPSFVLTEEDGALFEEACARWQPDGSQPAYAVGYYRSHTRDGMSLSPEDLDLLERYFPAPENVALLVKPFATKVSIAGFFVRNAGAFPELTPLEFPLRRRELTGESPPERRPLGERGHRTLSQPAPSYDRRRAARPRTPSAGPLPESAAAEEFDLETMPEDALAGGRRRIRGGWVWIPLSFVFLLLGVLLGFQSALTMGNKAASSTAVDFSLGLAVTRSGDNLTVKWNRNAPAIQMAQKGVLEIEDGGYAKPVDLDHAHLEGGSVIYRNSGDTVRLRMTVNLSGRSSVTETAEWRGP